MTTIYGIDLSVYNLTYVFVSLSLLYWFVIKYYNYWNHKSAQTVSISGYQRYFFPLPEIELQWYKLYGKIYRVDGNLVVAEPELIKQILVKDFNAFTDRRRRKTSHPIIDSSAFFARGDIWKRVRSISSPTFTSGKMKQMYPMVRECLTDMLTQLDNNAINGNDVDLKHVFGNYTMDVIARCAFGTKINAHIDPNNPFVTNGIKVFTFKWYRALPILLLPKFILEALNLRTFGVNSANEFFFNLARNLIENRKKENKKYTDFLQLLMDAELEETEKNTIQNKRLTENEILGQSWIFFVAGYETTSSTLAFCAYELALNPEIQDRLYNEIVAEIETNGEINHETLSKMPYLDACLSETLRKYPPLVRLERTANEDYNLSNTGITINKDKIVEIPVYAIHHSDEYYPNPDRFHPERFMPENREKLVSYTYLPFGTGPRNCIGMRFALLESKLCIAHLIKNYRLLRNERTEVPVNFKPILTFMLQSNSIMISIEKRM